jgi:hypothetical protein
MKKICLGLLLSLLIFIFPQKVFAQNGGAGVNISPIDPNQRPTIEALQALGAKWVRFVYVPDKAAENNFNYDSYINELNQAGIDVVMVLNQQTLWPSNNLQVDANYVSDFANMAGQLAAHYGNQVAAYEIWNEQDAKNNVASIYIPPGAYASLLAAAYNAIKENSNSFVVTGGMVAGDPNYLRSVIEAAGGLSADGVGVHPYIPGINIEAFRQTFLNFLAVSQGKPLWITEFGWETKDQQVQADYLRAVYELIRNEFGDKIATALWYTFTDNSGAGFGLVDFAGNPKLAFEYFQKYAALLEGILPLFPFFPFPVPTPPAYLYPPPTTCTPQSSGARDSRPDACDPCNKTSYKTYSCATSFTVYDTVSYEKREGGPDEPYCVEKDWGGMVVIDPSSTTIPFVGFKGESVDDKSDFEQKYLADYFEGTNEYYQDYSQYWLDWVNHAGVSRKLTPMGYQNELKKDMVDRAQKTVDSGGELMPGGVHNYKVNYSGRLCWDLPFLVDAFLTFASSYLDNRVIELFKDKAHFCAYSSDLIPFSLDLKGLSMAISTFNQIVPFDFLRISTWGHLDDLSANLTEFDGHFPPDPSEENYLEKWRAWKTSEGGKWFNLWSAVPMFSRNDTPGEIAPYLGRKSADGTTYVPIEIEKVPHLARLFEETLGLNELLLPQGTAGAPKFAQNQGGEENSLASAENKVLSQKTETESCSSGSISSNKEEVLGEKTYLAQGQGEGCFHLEAHSQISFYPGNKSAQVFVHVCFVSDGGDGDINLDLNGNHIAGTNRWNKAGGSFCYEPSWTGSPFNVNLGETFGVSYTGYVDSHSDICPDIRDSITCSFEFNGEGSIVTNCGPGEGLEHEVCDIWGPIPVADCFKEAIKDTNPNDDLCCKPIQIPLAATDAFINKDYTPCDAAGEYDCKSHQIEVTPGVYETIYDCKNHCYDTITEEVSRRFGINLAHPYLNEIWNLSTNNETFGIFNIFRPAQIPPFEDLDASSEISYSYCREYVYVPAFNFYVCLGQGQISPETGEFYFNHLGGVQKAKEWVTTKVLMPYVEQ